MGLYHTRPTVADIRAMKAHCQKISMLYVTTLEEAAAAAAAGIDMLSIEGRFFSPEMRESAGNASCRSVFHSDHSVSSPRLKTICARHSVSWRSAEIVSIAPRRSISRSSFATTPFR
jgi:ketopantoate hydroxymethyltransferase